MPRLRRPRCRPMVMPLAGRGCEQAMAAITGGDTVAMRSLSCVSHVGGDGGEESPPKAGDRLPSALLSVGLDADDELDVPSVGVVCGSPGRPARLGVTLGCAHTVARAVGRRV